MVFRTFKTYFESCISKLKVFLGNYRQEICKWLGRIAIIVAKVIIEKLIEQEFKH